MVRLGCVEKVSSWVGVRSSPIVQRVSLGQNENEQFKWSEISNLGR